jgi:uroporphyrin-III C-methyltransferase
MSSSSTGPGDVPRPEAGTAASASPAPLPESSATGPAGAVPSWALYGMAGLAVVSAVSLVVSLLLWQRLSGIQEQLARQSADSGAQAVEARTLAREAQELVRDTAARLAVTDTRVAELVAQRSQLDALVQGLSRSRDENLVVDIEAALRLAQQQAQLTLSPEPLVAALRQADQRLARGAQPALARVRAAIARDLDRIKAAGVADVPSMLARIDELTRQVDDLPLANAVGPQAAAAPRGSGPAPVPAAWWQRMVGVVGEQARGLVRISRIDHPEAMLLSPEQAFFLRENLKLKLLNARLSLLARQAELARGDLVEANAAIARYFEPSRRTQAAASAVQQMLSQLRTMDMPRIDETLALLDAAAAGR